MFWFLQLLAIGMVAWTGGACLGTRVRVARRGIWTVALVVIPFIVWFAATAWARMYADSDNSGWQWAEAWAHTGKWYALLSGALFGIRFAMTQEERRPKGLTMACVLLISVVALRTVPVYFLLGDGNWDQQGYLRQAPRLQCTCGSVALANYLKQFRGKTVTEREITKACRTTWEGSTSADLLRAAHLYGLTNASTRSLTWGELREYQKPAILTISTVAGMLHATLLVELNDKEAVFIDPAYGRWVIAPERLQHIWRGKTLLLE